MAAAVVLQEISSKLLVQCCKHSWNGGVVCVRTTVAVLKPMKSVFSDSLLISIHARLPGGHYLHDAVHIFQSIPMDRQHTVSVNAMIKCYLEHSENGAAISLYETLCISPSQPPCCVADDISHLLFLKACMRTTSARGHRDLHQDAHALIEQRLRTGPTPSISFLNTAMDFCGHVGAVDDAIRIFDCISNHHKDIVSFNTMLDIFVNHARCNDAIRLFRTLQTSTPKVTADDISNLLFMKACMGADRYCDGQQFIDGYANVMREQHVKFITVVIAFYGHFGRVECARHSFNAIAAHKKDVFAVNAMLKCYVDHKRFRDASLLFAECQRECACPIQPDDVTYILLLKTCVAENEFERGMEVVHDRVRHTHSIELLTTAVDFLGHFHCVEDAVQMFTRIPPHRHTIVSIGAMMKCLVDCGRSKQAMQLFQQSHAYGIEHTDVSVLLFLKACIGGDFYEQGKAVIDVHANIDIACIELLNTVIDFYAHFGGISAAENTFNRIPNARKDIVTIGAMMNAYHSSGDYNHALRLFDSVEHADRNVYCYSIALNVCASSEESRRGSQIIAELSQPQNIELWRHAHVQSAMIRFYTKTQDTRQALHMFENMDSAVLDADKTGSIYCAAMDCYAKIGDTRKLLSVFHDIKSRNNNNICNAMYTVALNGCAHSGMVEEALRIFAEIERRSLRLQREIPSQCVVAMIDCLARKAQLSEAEQMYHRYETTLDLKTTYVALSSLLSACRAQNDVVKAQQIVNEIQNTMAPYANEFGFVDEALSSSQIVMANIYAQNLQFEESNRLRSHTFF